MRRVLGFTLIELMITLAVIAILTAIAYPSYQDYIRRGIRSQGQQFLSDIAQRQEQYFLDQRLYATLLGPVAGGLNMTIPADVAAKYQPPVIVTTAPVGAPPTFRITLTPIVGGMMAVDGALVINNLQQRWREVDGNNIFNPGPLADCRWEESSCKPS